MDFIMLKGLLFILFLSVTCKDFEILVLSDLHYNEDYVDNIPPEAHCRHDNPEAKITQDRAPWGRYLCDAPYSLVRSAIAKAKSVLPRPDVILVLGDLVAHKIPCKAGKYCSEKTKEKIRGALANTTKEIGHWFKGMPVLHTMGNLDWYYHNQVPTVFEKAAYYQYTYNIFVRGHPGNQKIETEENLGTYMNGGYYYYDMSPTLRILAINSMYFFKKNDKDNDPYAGKDQMKWIKGQLKELSKQRKKAILFMHVPNEIHKADNDKRFWSSKFHTEYEELMDKYTDVVEMIIAGHLHIGRQKVKADLHYSHSEVQAVDLPFSSIITDLFSRMSYQQRIQKNYRYKAFENTYIANAIAPTNNNNPAFSIITLDSQYKPKKITVYSFDLPKSINTELYGTGDQYWSRLYDTNKDLGMEDLSSEELVKLSGRMVDNAKVTLRYLMFMMGHHISYNGMYYGLKGFHEKKYITLKEAAIFHVCPFNKFEECVLDY